MTLTKLPPLPKKGDRLTEAQLDDAVHAVQMDALAKGMIPIAGVMSRVTPEGLHQVLGFGHNHLAEGIPGIHGETGAVMNMGRLPGGYKEVIATSSLNPCPFCQRTLACHLGVRQVRILDTTNYVPDVSSYPKTLKPALLNHDKTAAVFGEWVKDSRNEVLWERDIGIPPKGKKIEPVFDIAQNEEKVERAMAMAHHKAKQGLASGEAPIGAVILDSAGEIISAGHAKIVANNDPSLTAAMSAWRGAGGREHWKDKTLLLTTGPDHIAFAMFKIFGFGQLVIASETFFKGQLDEVKKLGVPVTVLADTASDPSLKTWLGATPLASIREYLGADWS